MDQDTIGYSDVCVVIGRATVNLIKHGDEPSKDQIISMLVSYCDIDRDPMRTAVYHKAIRVIRG
ncbi:DUF2767 domain-containing protein [Yersinia enterocolitica]|nr:DUF2767 domain-containing protein [Yersinia enterocolitica]